MAARAPRDTDRPGRRTARGPAVAAASSLVARWSSFTHVLVMDTPPSTRSATPVMKLDPSPRRRDNRWSPIRGGADQRGVVGLSATRERELPGWATHRRGWPRAGAGSSRRRAGRRWEDDGSGMTRRGVHASDASSVKEPAATEDQQYQYDDQQRVCVHVYFPVIRPARSGRVPMGRIPTGQILSDSLV
jgi:hypothetical protein